MTTNRLTTSKHKLAQAIALGVLALAANQAQAANYTFSDLGTFNGAYIGAGANGVNNLGQVTGYGVANNNFVPYVWNGDIATPLELGPNGTGAVGIGINNAGQSSGYNNLPNDGGAIALRWEGSVAVPLDGLAGGYSVAMGINNLGQVAGFSAANSTWSEIHAARWDGTAITDLGGLGGNNSMANSINDAGQVVGFSSTAGENSSHATSWTGTVITDLGTLGGTNSAANAINNAGQIVGNSLITNDETTHATLWDANTGIPSDLGSLGLDSNAAAISNAGQIVGGSTLADGSGHATLWDGNSIIDLNNFLPAGFAADGWVLYQANAISDNGIIVGWAENGTDLSTATWGSFKLTPSAVPVPGTVWLFGSSLAGFVGMKRREQGLAV